MQQRTAHPSTLRRVSGGDIIGSQEPDGTLAWRGIPYAAPPVGPLRWRAPQPVQPWAGVREALAHGAMAPQYGGLLEGLPPAQHGQIVGEEGCLTLNVFAPPGTTDGQKRPVMVWIHGGGLAVGTSATYDVARKLALRQGVVVVTINYRLGVLGWFTHPALAAADGATPEERSGNFGLLDQIAALRWVRDHIAAFGGDPGCVTVFGESAGGQSVLLLLASPLAAGLFHRAIAQSPVAESFSLHEAIHGSDTTVQSHRLGALEVTARLRAAASDAGEATASDDAAFLRSRTPAQLLAAFTPGSVGIYLSPRPARDGVVLPTAPLTEVFASGAWNRMPVLLGSNRDEMRTFLADKPEHVKLLGGKLPLLHDRAAYLAESRTLSDAWRVMHVDEPADAMLASGHADVWTYRFDWDELPAIPFIRPDLLLGAAHAMEMAFAFGDTEGEFDLFKANTPFNRKGRVALAQAMSNAWATFARDGQPALPDAQSWPRRQASGAPDSLVFDTPRDGGLRMAALRGSMDGLKQQLIARDWPAEWRCRIYARLFLWYPIFGGRGSPAEYRLWSERLLHRLPPEAYRPQVEM